MPPYTSQAQLLKIEPGGCILYKVVRNKVWFVALGKGQASKLDEFSEKRQRGESFSIQKIYVANFGDFKQGF